jgi:hypothetical protein
MLMHDQSERADGQNAAWSQRWVATLGVVVGWGWAVVAGGGGVWLLWTKGPWPLTNGWFALASGISACPLTAWILKRCTGIGISGWVQVGFAIIFFVAGKIALTAGI